MPASSPSRCPVPQIGVARRAGILGAARCRAAVILTTSAVADVVGEYAQPRRPLGARRRRSRRAGLRMRRVDSDAGRPLRARAGVSAVHVGLDPRARRRDGLAPQRHRQPRAGDVRLLRRQRRGAAGGHHGGFVAALLSRHGLDPRHLRADPGRPACGADEPDGVPAAPGPVDAAAGQQHPVRSRPHRTSPSNWRCDGHRTPTWRASTWRRGGNHQRHRTNPRGHHRAVQ